MSKRLIKLNGELYLLEANMDRMAKDLPAGTLVFCLSETHMNDPKECIRHSTKGDNCYACQPLIASTVEIPGCELIEFTDCNKN